MDFKFSWEQKKYVQINWRNDFVVTPIKGRMKKATGKVARMLSCRWLQRFLFFLNVVLKKEMINVT